MTPRKKTEVFKVLQLKKSTRKVGTTERVSLVVKKELMPQQELSTDNVESSTGLSKRYSVLFSLLQSLE